MRLSGAMVVATAGALVAGCGASRPARHAATTATGTATAPAATATATGTGGVTPPPAATNGAGARDWTRFGYDAARTNAAPSGPTAAEVARLGARTVRLPGTVDSSPILLASVTVHGARHDLLVVTTTYGRTVGLDAASGALLWTFTPSSTPGLVGSAQITTATPVADPDRAHVYAASPDGFIHKLNVADGREVRTGGWPVSVTRDPTHEKIAAALNLDGPDVLVTTGGYLGDAPPYQGKVIAIDRAGGRIAHVVNALCANRATVFATTSCPASDAAIWGRAGAVVDPGTHRIYVATGNAPFDGATDWGDSTLELAPAAAGILRHWTPTDQAQLNASDGDVGSTSPALLPDPTSTSGTAAALLQGGKDAQLHLLDLTSSLSPVIGPTGSRLGGEVQTVAAPGGGEVFTAPAVLHAKGTTIAFVATGDGTAAYTFSGDRLHALWSNGHAGTSPILAGDLLWVYDPGGALDVYVARTGRLVRSLPAPAGHWNSPIVADGRAFLPSGNANDHAATGVLTIYG